MLKNKAQEITKETRKMRNISRDMIRLPFIWDTSVQIGGGWDFLRTPGKVQSSVYAQSREGAVPSRPYVREYPALTGPGRNRSRARGS